MSAMAMDMAKKTQRERRIIVGLLVVLLYVVWSALKPMGLGPSSASKKPLSALGSITMPTSLPQTFAEHWKQLEPQPERAVPEHRVLNTGSSVPTYTATNLRDPLRSLLPEKPAQAAAHELRAPQTQAQASAPPALTLQGLWWSGSGARAIINGDVYGVGDEVAGATITDIAHDGVTIDFQGTTLRFTTATGSTDRGLSRVSRGRR